MPSRPDRYDPLLSVVDCLRLVHAADDVEAVLQATTETACAATGSTRGLGRAMRRFPRDQRRLV